MLVPLWMTGRIGCHSEGAFIAARPITPQDSPSFPNFGFFYLLSLPHGNYQFKTMLSRKTLTISCLKTVRIIESDNILYCKSQDYCSAIYMNNRSSFVVSKTLSKLTKELNDPRFLRVSRSFLVNFSYIDH